jgi:subtilisin-like proprotein convertase family protein
VVHPHRGDLRLTLVAPDGSSVVLQVETIDAGDDIHAVYGLDAEPSQPLSALAGKSAAGTWTLKIVDTIGADVGRLVSWGMMFRFAGDEPMATRGAADSSSRFIPVAGSVAGAFGTKFVSDARIANVGTTTAHATMFFTPSGADGSTTFSAVKLEIPPGEIVALDDFVASLFRESGTGAVELRGETAKLIVTSRIYNRTTIGTYGQFVRVGSESIGNEPGVTLHILHLSNGPAFRSNLGVAEVGGGAGTIMVRLIDASGAFIKTEDVTLSPFGHLQIPLLGGPAGTPSDAFRAEVSVSSGTARVVAYGSVVDNSSGDAIFVPGSISSGSQVTPPPNPFVIPAVIRAPGANGTYWRSDVRVLNRSSSLAQHVAFTFAPADGGERLTTSIEIPANGTAGIDDVLHTLFSKVDGRGSLAIDSLDASDTRASLVVTSRTWTIGAFGTFGQFIPASSPAFDGLERGLAPSSLIHVDSNSEFRCNVGLTEVSGQGASLRVRLWDATGAERFVTDVVVPANANLQFNLAAAGAPPISNGRLTFEVIEGEGRVLPYASVVDNATGDPIFVSP